MKRETIMKIGGAVGLIGCITADIAVTAILKSAAPAATNKLNKLAITAGIAFLGYAAGSIVENAVKKDTESLCDTIDNAKQSFEDAAATNNDPDTVIYIMEAEKVEEV